MTVLYEISLESNKLELIIVEFGHYLWSPVLG